MTTAVEPETYLGIVDYLGMDPEFFVVNDKGKAISSHMLKGFTRDTTPGYAISWNVHRDGPAFEIGTSAHTCRDYIVPTVQLILNQMHKQADKLGYKLSLDATVELTAESIKDAPKDVSEFGCQPDIDAYTLQDKAADMPSPKFRKRFTGGHIHRGKKGDRMQLAALAVAADYLIALPAVALLGEAHKEKEAERRKFYGQAGSFRIQPHGFEYRTLSATGFLFHPVLTYAWFEVIRSLTLKPEDLRKVAQELKMGEVRAAINNHDVDAARQIYLDDNLFDEIIDLVARRNGTRRDLLKALIVADMDGKSWNPDPQTNWAWDTFFNHYTTANHQFWGDQSAMSGVLDESILPQRDHVLRGVGWSDARIKMMKPSRFHPYHLAAKENTKKIGYGGNNTWFEPGDDPDYSGNVDDSADWSD